MSLRRRLLGDRPRSARSLRSIIRPQRFILSCAQRRRPKHNACMCMYRV